MWHRIVVVEGQAEDSSALFRKSTCRIGLGLDRVDLEIEVALVAEVLLACPVAGSVRSCLGPTMIVLFSSS